MISIIIVFLAFQSVTKSYYDDYDYDYYTENDNNNNNNNVRHSSSKSAFPTFSSLLP